MSLFNIRTLLALLLLPSALAATPTVDWKTLKTSKGDSLPDFSYCGYHASNDSLPSASRAAATTLSATSGDQASRIQSALTHVASSGGGVVALKAGKYQLKSGITIPGGTTLRGAGSGKTILEPASASFDAVTMGAKVANPKPGKAVAITDRYVPVGASVVTLQSASGLKVGQHVSIQRAVTKAWVLANGDGGLPPKSGTWLVPGDVVYQPRIITSIKGNSVTLNVPLTDQLDREYMSPELVAFTPPSAGAEMGLEELSIELSPSCSGKKITDKSCSHGALNVRSWSTDSWARSLAITGFNNAVNVAANASQITIDSVTILRNGGATDQSAGMAADVAISGTQVLVIDSAVGATTQTARSFPALTQGLAAGPNAVVRLTSGVWDSPIQPHAHWAHGLLIDNTTAQSTLVNRAGDGSGHGWAINSGVLWNNVGNYSVQSPPLGTNWGIGCHGGDKQKGLKGSESNGTFVDEKEEVNPPSLFEAQLAARGISKTI